MLGRLVIIAAGLWTFFGAPTLCAAGLIVHACDPACEPASPEDGHHGQEGGCGHESGCASDPCTFVAAPSGNLVLAKLQLPSAEFSQSAAVSYEGSRPPDGFSFSVHLDDFALCRSPGLGRSLPLLV